MNVPKLRFREFSGEWEEKKYGEIYSFFSTNSFSRDNLNYEAGTVKNIHYGDIHTKFSTIFDMEKEKVPFINNEIDLTKIKEENYCLIGDLVIADASEDYTDIGKTIEISNLNNEKVLSGLHTFLARPNKFDMALGYMGYSLQSRKTRKQVMTIAQGTKVLSLSTTRLGNIILDLPSKPEQQKIASFLTSVDTKIEQLTKKRALLEEYKKGVMQKIFAQEIRFHPKGISSQAHGKADNGSEFPEWEEKKLEDISIFTKGKGISKNDISVDGKNECIRYGELYTHYKETINIVISKTDLPKDEFVLSQANDIIIPSSGETAIDIATASCVLKDGVILGGDLNIIRTKEDGLFLSYLFNNHLKSRIVQLSQGSSVMHLYSSALKNLKLYLPCIEEQTKIANFLSSIDTKIEQVQNQLKQTKEFKKALLQQMFV